jgi:hypothetical protein
MHIITFHVSDGFSTIEIIETRRVSYVNEAPDNENRVTVEMGQMAVLSTLGS